MPDRAIVELAYIEFGEQDSVQTAMALDESLFKGRQIKVVSKRTNKPDGFMGGFSVAPRGRAMPFPARGGYPYMRAMRGRAFN